MPSLNKVTRVLELQDTQITAFLLDECKWTAWKPPASWRMKVGQVYDLTVHMAVRKHGFLTNEIRMRVGRKWVGPHHHNSDLAHEVKSQWLHRVDYETQDNIETAESAFFQTIKLAWDKYLCELSRLPKEDLRSFEETGNGFPLDEQDQHTSLRVKYLLETSLGTIMSERGTFFRSAHQYELWRMAQEDGAKHRECFGDNFAGPLLEAEIEALSELYEGKAMELEDVGVGGGGGEDPGDSPTGGLIPSGPSNDWCKWVYIRVALQHSHDGPLEIYRAARRPASSRISQPQREAGCTRPPEAGIVFPPAAVAASISVQCLL
ncbi:hypothetical protein FI667_g6224, partial [Globisporangium splendens]